MAIIEGALDNGSSKNTGRTAVPVVATLDGQLQVKDAQQETALDLLRQILLECRASRLALEELVNQGNTQQHDFLALARTED